MTPVETSMIVERVQAFCPAQTFTAGTTAAWHEILENVDYDLAHQAVKRVAMRKPFIAAADLVEEIKTMWAEYRRERQAAVQQDPAWRPDADPDDVTAYLLDLRHGRGRDEVRLPLAADERRALIAGFEFAQNVEPKAIEA